MEGKCKGKVKVKLSITYSNGRVVNHELIENCKNTPYSDDSNLCSACGGCVVGNFGIGVAFVLILVIFIEWGLR